ncbi:MAG TPA: pyridoxal-phosphate dependent enzyme, partial [Saliniramus sp.]|nr:pyridoxal-phosphate dependent enzyme [Saliniramus sp.]
FNIINGENRPIGGATLAEGVAVKNPGALTLPIVRDLVSKIILVEEDIIERAVNACATLQRTMAEGAGAAGIAGMLKQPELFAGKRVGVVLCGGNIDARILASVMVRELERDERIVAFRIYSNDRPGLLGRVATRLGELGANILEVSHGRLYLDVPAKGVTVDLTIETRDAAHTAEIFAALRAEGYEPQRIDPRGLTQTGP